MATPFDVSLFAGDATVTIMGALVFLTVAIVAFGVMHALRIRGVVRRRAAGIAPAGGDSGEGNTSLRQSSARAVVRLIDRANRHYASIDSGNLRMLRRRLLRAGIFNPRAVGFFFVIRTALAIALGATSFVLAPAISDGSVFWLLVGAGGLAGYVGPSVYVDKLAKARLQEYRAGFPDFMDLLVVCADAGLSMEAALERVGRELGDTYPALAINIHMTNLEIRAGRSLSEALEHFGDRLGLEEVRAFATLIQQSDELGSSITEALRVYSEDMRHKRLSRAEEKAYSLPARLALPMMVCIFPVLFVVILLPVVVRFKMGAY
ncbi:MAG: type II secretion system F family protein [Proteobacteria bacterium]|nr:type II secretion system F family protein [Pseudomonadota bacterium]